MLKRISPSMSGVLLLLLLLLISACAFAREPVDGTRRLASERVPVARIAESTIDPIGLFGAQGIALAGAPQGGNRALQVRSRGHTQGPPPHPGARRAVIPDTIASALLPVLLSAAVGLLPELVNAISNGNYNLAVSLGLVLAVFVFQTFVWKSIPKRWIPWSLVGVTVAGAVAHALKTGADPWMAVLSGAQAGLGAIGVHQLWKHRPVRKPKPTVTP